MIYIPGGYGFRGFFMHFDSWKAPGGDGLSAVGPDLKILFLLAPLRRDLEGPVATIPLMKQQKYSKVYIYRAEYRKLILAGNKDAPQKTSFKGAELFGM